MAEKEKALKEREEARLKEVAAEKKVHSGSADKIQLIQQMAHFSFVPGFTQIYSLNS